MGTPTLGEYMHWLRQSGGKCRSGIGADEKIGMVPVTLLQAPSGAYVIHSNDKQNKRLSQMTVDYFDRRLGINSPWGSKTTD